jgi:Cu(I)/Ag(I) efflux system periplasmic protein CusF
MAKVIRRKSSMIRSRVIEPLRRLPPSLRDRQDPAEAPIVRTGEPAIQRGTLMNRLICALLLTAGLACAALAQTASASMVAGEVRKVDKEAKKITIKHGEIKNLEMPPMTMVYQVQHPALLDKAKAGDSVRFVAERTADGAFVITDIQPAK